MQLPPLNLPLAKGEKIAIAGAGLVGRLLAWRLARAGHSVTLYDKDDRRGEQSAGMTAAAMISPFAELAVSEPQVFELGMRSLALYPQWLSELEADSGCQVMYRHNGSLAVAHTPDVSSLRHFQDLLLHRLPSEHVGNVQVLNSDAIAQAEPQLAGRFSHGVLLREEAQLDNGELFAALAVALERLGVVWHEQHVIDDVSALASDFDVVIDARGIGAKDSLSIRGVRGEVLTVDAPEVTLQRPVRLMHPRYMLYVVPRANHRFIIGATELESEDMGEVTVRSALELLSALYSVHSGFAEARIVKWSVNCRPALPDNLPLVGWKDGVLTVNGLYRHGYLLAPACVEEAMGLVVEYMASNYRA
jgi:glycine oxidase